VLHCQGGMSLDCDRPKRIATVFARRYQSHRWVPWVAYGVAGTIGFSRITLQAHFPADVFLGAALGYSISRFVVLRGQ
jgi:membrane-associated phospholipid phosphatase